MTAGHAMPFGAELSREGVRFRVWAPRARAVDLLIEDPEGRTLPMRAEDEGWFATLVPGAGAGTRYRFRIDGGLTVPDPASRYQPEDVLGPSAVVDPAAYCWGAEHWRGRPWHEAVFYELHVGAFTPEGTFEGVRERLDDLAALGVTAVELMPIGDFAGRRNWGYDGALPFAPDAAYGTPENLKALVDAAHARGLMMFLDVVYNHFGPEGNFLAAYAPAFFTERFHTPWGAAINFRQREVREFFVHNALYWLEEYRFDGLRLDAVHALVDESTPDIVEEIAAAVRSKFAQERTVHLVLENEHNAARYLARTQEGAPRLYDAQWNDDIHHVLHVIATGEQAGYYADYAARPVALLGRCLREGFAYQGEASAFRNGARRGERSDYLPPLAFVSFLQNHDQIGNRAMGERLVTQARPEILKALIAIMLLAPNPPLLFMGEEWGAPEPFLFFCDFHDALAAAVREGRRNEFAHFPTFRDAAARARIPDPNAAATFRASCLDWTRREEAPHRAWRDWYRSLLRLRRRVIAPRLTHLASNPAHKKQAADKPGDMLHVAWDVKGGTLSLTANLSDRETAAPVVADARLLFATDAAPPSEPMPPWCVRWWLTKGAAP